MKYSVNSDYTKNKLYYNSIFGGDLSIAPKMVGNVTKYGVINSKGDVVFDFKYNDIKHVFRNNGPVKNFLYFSDGDNPLYTKYSIYDLNKKEWIIKDVWGDFVEMPLTSYGCNLFLYSDKDVFLDVEQNKEFVYDGIESTESFGQFIVENKGKKGIVTCYYDDKSVERLKESLKCEHDNIAVEYQIIDPYYDLSTGEMVIDTRYIKPLYFVTDAGKIRCIKVDGKDGKVIEVASNIDGYKRNGNNHLIIEKNGKLGVLDFDGKEVLPYGYDSIEEIENHIIYGVGNLSVARVKIGDKYGVKNVNGEEIWPCIFDKVEPFNEDGEAIAEIGGYKVKIGIDGKSADIEKLRSALEFIKQGKVETLELFFKGCPPNVTPLDDEDDDELGDD